MTQELLYENRKKKSKSIFMTLLFLWIASFVAMTVYCTILLNDYILPLKKFVFDAIAHDFTYSNTFVAVHEDDVVVEVLE